MASGRASMTDGVDREALCPISAESDVDNRSFTASYAALGFTGFRIVEGSTLVGAPLGGMTLARLGTDLIRFDSIGRGLDFRRWPCAPKWRESLVGQREQMTVAREDHVVPAGSVSHGTDLTVRRSWRHQ
jgi:hypothetical protein